MNLSVLRLTNFAVIGAVVYSLLLDPLLASEDSSVEENYSGLSHEVVLEGHNWQFTGEDEFDIAEQMALTLPVADRGELALNYLHDRIDTSSKQIEKFIYFYSTHVGQDQEAINFARDHAKSGNLWAALAAANLLAHRAKQRKVAVKIYKRLTKLSTENHKELVIRALDNLGRMIHHHRDLFPFNRKKDPIATAVKKASKLYKRIRELDADYVSGEFALMYDFTAGKPKRAKREYKKFLLRAYAVKHPDKEYSKFAVKSMPRTNVGLVPNLLEKDPEDRTDIFSWFTTQDGVEFLLGSLQVFRKQENAHSNTYLSKLLNKYNVTEDADELVANRTAFYELVKMINRLRRTDMSKTKKARRFKNDLLEFLCGYEKPLSSMFDTDLYSAWADILAPTSPKLSLKLYGFAVTSNRDESAAYAIGDFQKLPTCGGLFEMYKAKHFFD